MPEEDRLFAALNTSPYRDFATFGKEWEFRGVNDQFNEDTVWIGRLAELRRGYSTGDSLWGQITAVETFDDLAAVPDRIDPELIAPRDDPAEFVPRARDLVGDYDEWIAFRVPDTQPLRPRRCTACGAVMQDAPYMCWLFKTCRSCAMEPAPDRWGDGTIDVGTYRKWRYFPRWHMTEHPETPKRVATDGGDRSDEAPTKWETIKWILGVYPEMGRDFLRWYRSVSEIVRGNVSPIGEGCRIRGCSREAVARVPNNDRWREDRPVCRFHWITLWTTVAVLVSTPVAALIALYLAMLFRVVP